MRRRRSGLLTLARRGDASQQPEQDPTPSHFSVRVCVCVKERERESVCLGVHARRLSFADNTGRFNLATRTPQKIPIAIVEKQKS